MTTPRERTDPEGTEPHGASSPAGTSPAARPTSDSDRPPSREVSPVHGAARTLRSTWRWAQRLRPWRAFSHFTDVGGTVLAAGMSYQAVFAVFAALWVGFGVFGLWLGSRPELLQTLIDQINLLVPGLVGEGGPVPLEALLAAQRSIDWSSIIAGVALLWIVLTWFTGTRRAIRIIFGLDVKQYRNALLLKLRDLLLATLFFVALLVSAGLTLLSSAVADWILEWLGLSAENWLLGGFGMIARYALLYVFDVLVLLGIHIILAEVTEHRWAVIKGCALGGVALLGLKILGSMLLGGATSNPLLASFAVIVGLFIWFNLICRVLLLTASWIATGLDRKLGLPAESV